MKPKFTLTLAMCLTALSATTYAAPERVQSDRYTLVQLNSTEAQRNPLKAVVTLSFGSNITTVGNAIDELLKGSGYYWQNTQLPQDKKRKDTRGKEVVTDQLLNQLPLPSVLRSLGPIRLHEALSTIAGEAWTLQVDEVKRTIWFTINNDVLKNHTAYKED